LTEKESTTQPDTAVQTSIGRAARGSIFLMLAQPSYFLFGYLAVVLLARALGPENYAVYGVILSVLVWVEQVGRFGIPSAAAKMIAEDSGKPRGVEKGSLLLNLSFYSALFFLFWTLAPFLERWFSIEGGTYLFRLAAIDLPLFGAYTALQAIHQGHHRFLRLALSNVVYAGSKFVGILLLLATWITVPLALVVNFMTTLLAVLFLLPGLRLNWKSQWTESGRALLLFSAPMLLYSVFLVLSGTVNLWILQIMRPGDQTGVGLYVAAWNIAKVPAFALVAGSAVLIPSVSQAAANRDFGLVRIYFQQSVRFFLLLFLPAVFVLSARPEELMRLVYSGKYSGAGSLLVVLLVAEGFLTMGVVLGSIIIAVGKVRKATILAALSIFIMIPLTIAFVGRWGALGAAASGLVVQPLILGLLFQAVRTETNALPNLRSVLNIAAAGALMFAPVLLPTGIPWPLLLLAGLFLYAGALWFLGEVGLKDIEILRRREPRVSES